MLKIGCGNSDILLPAFVIIYILHRDLYTLYFECIREARNKSLRT